MNVGTRTDERKAELQGPSEYHGPPVMGVDKKMEIKEEQPKAPASKEEETPGNPKLEDELYVNIASHGFKPIKGKKVTIPGV